MAYGLRLNDGQLFKALEAVGKAGGLSVVHAENWDIITTLIERNINAGHLSPDWHPRCRPAVLEGEAAGRVIDIADYLGVAVHIFHVSCKDSMLKIQAARQRGLPVTGETCPQYLFLTINAFDAPGVQGALPVCAPPIRTKMDQQALWQALREDDLQIVTTDHCPFTFAQKQHGFEQNFSKIPGGVPSIEMRLSAIYSSGVVSGQISLNRWVDICCTTPAKLAGFKNKGDIAIGYDADLVIFDPEKQVTLSADFLHENVEWTPYEGQKVKGWPVTTISRGNVVVENGEFKGEQGMGKFIARSF
jgi:dihydropyrimidinase